MQARSRTSGSHSEQDLPVLRWQDVAHDARHRQRRAKSLRALTLRLRQRPARARGRRASAASATSSCSGVGSAVAIRCWSSCPGRASARASGMLGVAHHPAEDLGRGRERAERGGERAPAAQPLRARGRRGVAPAAVASSSGPTRCEPQRSCSFVAPLAVLVRADRDVLGAVVARRARPGAARASPARARRRRRRAPARPAASRVGRIARALNAALTRHGGEDAPAARTANRTSGRARRCTAGRTSSDSSSCAGPRRSGRLARRARACAPGGDLHVAAGVRTAHAHEVGPCTSTPFASAIPPSRTFFSAIVDRLATASRPTARHGAGSRRRARGRRSPLRSSAEWMSRAASVRRSSP